MTTEKPVIDEIFSSSAYFNWSWRGCGHGQLSFYTDKETGKIHFQNEFMSRESVKQILHEFVEKIVDEGIFDDER